MTRTLGCAHVHS